MTTQNPPGRRVVGIVQARMESTRLPGKSMALIAGKPLLQRVIERCRAAKTIAEVRVATTTNPADDAIESLCRLLGVGIYRGSEGDVLDRYCGAALEARAEVIVRITADDPLKDPQVIDQIVGRLLDRNLDYASNTMEPTFPEGLDVEAFTLSALLTAGREARLASEREHVTPYLWKHPERFHIENLRLAVDLSHHRWTVDYDEDLDFVRAVYESLGGDRLFLMHEVLGLLAERPELIETNRGRRRNEGYLKSLAEDRVQARL